MSKICSNPDCGYVEEMPNAQYCGMCGWLLIDEKNGRSKPSQKVSSQYTLIGTVVGIVLVIAVVIIVSLKSTSRHPAPDKPNSSLTAVPEEVPSISHNPSGDMSSANPFSSPKGCDSDCFTVQVGAFADRTNAQNLRDILIAQHEDAYIEEFIKDGIVFYRVRVGTFSTKEEANIKSGILAASGYPTVVMKKGY